EGDAVLAFGKRAGIERLATMSAGRAEPLGFPDLQALGARFFLVEIAAGSPLHGLTLESSHLGQLVGITVAGFVRDDETILGADPGDALAAGDRLLVGGDPVALLSVLDLDEILVEDDVESENLESADIGVVEATVAPRAQIAGRTLRQLAFRERHGVQVVALWREGSPRRSDLADVTLREGDALLLQGPREKLHLLGEDPDLVVLTPGARPQRRTHKAPVAIGGLALLIGLVVSGWQPIQVAAFAAATFVMLGGALTMQEAYRAVEWRMIFLLAALLPLGIALERSGAAALAAHAVTDLAGPYGPHVLFAGLVVLASLLSQSTDSGPAVIILAPVTLQVAAQAGLSPATLMMGIALGASAAFTTPFSHKAHLLVMGAGGYRTADYLKVGTPLTLLVIAIIVALVPVLLPFR
ncbi:SLC13 family permease, partial [bacterium]|nr:SLC13 family permease [bacterium]